VVLNYVLLQTVGALLTTCGANPFFSANGSQWIMFFLMPAEPAADTTTAMFAYLFANPIDSFSWNCIRSQPGVLLEHSPGR